MELEHKKQLRQAMTDAELKLWYFLRAKRLKGHKFRRQHSIGPYIVDFYCHTSKLVVEIDGAHHFEEPHAIKDAQRTAWLEAQGLTVIRFDNRQVLLETEGVLSAILKALK